MEKSFFFLASDIIMSFMVCMKQALQIRNSLSHEMSLATTWLNSREFTFVDWSALDRSLGMKCIQF
jgi:hypothetical protein